MEISINKLNNFKLYLLSEKEKIMNELKHLKNVKLSGNDNEINKYKSLLFKTHQLDYFISLLDDKKEFDDGVFVSYDTLSNLIVRSNICPSEQLAVLYHFLLINKELLSNFEAIPSANSIYDNFCVLMNLPLGRVCSLSNQAELLKELKNPKCNKAFNYYSGICRKYNSLFRFVLTGMLSFLDGSDKSNKYFSIVSFIDSLDNINMNKTFVSNIKELLFIEYYNEICSKDSLLFFEDNAGWIKKVCTEYNLEYIYVHMIGIAEKIINPQDDDYRLYICELDGYINYIIDIIEKENYDLVIPNNVLNYQKKLELPIK